MQDVQNIWMVLEKAIMHRHYEVVMENGCYECDENGNATHNKVPSKLERTVDIVSKTENIVAKVSDTFNAATSSELVKVIIENKKALAQLNREIISLQVQGAERRADLQQKYEVHKSTLEGINHNINSAFEELKKYDVNTMSETQAKLYEGLVKGILQLRAGSMKILQDIFG